MTSEDVARRYVTVLRGLKQNSKPIINQLTMMAEDYLKHAKTVQHVIQQELKVAAPESKLPILYLIDSIVKNVKKDYLTLFSETIPVIFPEAFWRIMRSSRKVDEKVKKAMWKLRTTWNDIFPAKKLYLLDQACHKMDNGWPCTPPAPTNIHINPEFLKKQMQTAPGPASAVPTYARPVINNELLQKADPKIRAEMLEKQRMLIELEMKKTELELMMQASSVTDACAAAELVAPFLPEPPVILQSKLEEFVIQARKNTEAATSILSMPSLVMDPVQIPDTSQNAFLEDPRRRRGTVVKNDVDADVVAVPSRSKSNTSFPMKHIENSVAQKSVSSTDVASQKRVLLSPARSSDGDRKSDSPRRTRFSSPKKSESESPRKERLRSSSPADPRKRKYDGSPKKSGDSKHSVRGRERNTSESDGHRSSARKSKSDDSLSGKDDYDGPSKRRRSDRSSREESKDLQASKSRREQKAKDTLGRTRGRRTSESEDVKVKVEPKSSKKSSATSPDDYNARKKEVLKHSYKKKAQDRSQPVEVKTESHGDVDLRMEVKVAMDNPAPNGAIDDLFGRGDVDYRAQPTPGASWSQMKRHSRSHESLDGNLENQDVSMTDVSGDEDIRKILRNQIRPPLAVSPANSVASDRSTCDALGRPYLYNRLPDDPMERKRSLDQRPVDPVEKFMSLFIQRPSAENGGNLTEKDLNRATEKLQQHFEGGFLNLRQRDDILSRIIKINEVNKIRDAQMLMGRETMSHASTRFGGPSNVPPGFGNEIVSRPLGDASWETRTPAIPAPLGPNPFEVAAAKAQPPQQPAFVDNPPPFWIPPPDMNQVAAAKWDKCGMIPIDDIPCEVRFYGNAMNSYAVVIKGAFGEEPRSISFRGDSVTIIIDEERPLQLAIGESQEVMIGARKHRLRIGAPTRELYIDHKFHEARFGGDAITVWLDNRSHTFRLEGPPPHVEVGKEIRNDLLAGRVNVFVNGDTKTIYLDDKMQLLDLNGFPVIMQFTDNFHKIKLNGEPFPVFFGGPPKSVVVPTSGQEFWLRFGTVNPKLTQSMKIFCTAKGEQNSGIGLYRGRGRGGRGGLRPPFNPHQQLPQMHFNGAHSSNPLDMIADAMPAADSLNRSFDSRENSYVLEKPKSESHTDTVNVQDLLSQLLKAGLLPAAKSEDKQNNNDKGVAVSEKKEEPPKPSVEVIDVKWSSIKERRPALVKSLSVGVQCGSCGLRYPADQNVRYTQHLDWHFRQNRKGKSSTKKANSRKWYYDLSDWIQFEEIEDLESRERSVFELQEQETDGQRSPGAIANVESSVLLAGNKDALCPGCEEKFERFYDEEAEEWRLRDAILAESEEPGVVKVYHPICYQDVLAALEGKSSLFNTINQEVPLELQEPVEPMETEAPKTEAAAAEEDQKASVEEDEDEVLIIKEGKPEPVVMDIDLELDDEHANVNTVEVSDGIERDSDNQNSMDASNVLPEGSPSAIDKQTDEQSESVECMSSSSITSLHTGASVQASGSNELLPRAQAVSSPITIVEDDSNDLFSTAAPGSSIFEIALTDRSIRPEIEDEEEKRIVYRSMQFDVPAIIIKQEPVDPDDLKDEELQDEPPVPVMPTVEKPTSVLEDIDLTAEDENTSDSASQLSKSMIALDGNIQLGLDTPAPARSKPLFGGRIRVNISDLNTDSQSPKGSPKHDPSKSPEDVINAEDLVSSASSEKSTEEQDSEKQSAQADAEEEVELEPISLKPRLRESKLAKQEVRKSGKEVSGLCTIC